MQKQDLMSIGSDLDTKEIKVVTVDVSHAASQPCLKQSNFNYND